MKQFNRTYAEVNLDAIRHNIDEVHKNIKRRNKGNGNCEGKCLWAWCRTGCEGIIWIYRRRTYEDLVQYQISQTVYTWEMAEQLSETALKLGKKQRFI